MHKLENHIIDVCGILYSILIGEGVPYVENQLGERWRRNFEWYHREGRLT